MVPAVDFLKTQDKQTPSLQRWGGPHFQNTTCIVIIPHANELGVYWSWGDIPSDSLAIQTWSRASCPSDWEEKIQVYFQDWLTSLIKPLWATVRYRWYSNVLNSENYYVELLEFI